MRALATEHTASVLPPLLRALTALVHGTPYQRMQPGLLLLVVQVRNQYTVSHNTHNLSMAATQAIWPRLDHASNPTPLPLVAVPVALTTLAAALMHKHECPQLTAWLHADAGPLVAALLRDPLGGRGPPERLTVLRGVARGAPAVVLLHWDTCLHQTAVLVAAQAEREAVPSEHCAQQGVLLLAALLTASAGDDVAIRWASGCDALLRQALLHPSCLVRCAGSSLAAAVPAEVLGSAALGLLVAAAHDDGDAAGRAAALKALGMVGGEEKGVGAALSGLRDRTLSVRVAAAWAAANMCDTLRQRGLGQAAVHEALCHGTWWIFHCDGVSMCVSFSTDRGRAEQ